MLILLSVYRYVNWAAIIDHAAGSLPRGRTRRDRFRFRRRLTPRRACARAGHGRLASPMR